MEWLLVLAGAVMAGTAGLVVSSAASIGARMRAAARRGAAQTCGLTEIEAHPTGVVTGRSGALRVRLDTVKGREAHFRVEIEGVTDGVEITPAGRSPVPSDVLVGDPEVDVPLVFRGPRATVRGLLGEVARDRLVRVLTMDADVHVRAGGLVAELRRRLNYAGSFAEWLTPLLELAHALEPGPSDADRLAAIARKDRLEGVRASALESLAKDLPHDPLTRPALHDAARDRSRAVRLQAALALGGEGCRALHELALDVATPTALATAAVDGLARHREDEEARELLYALAAAADDAVAVAAVEALGQQLTLARARPLLEAAAADLRVPLARALLRWLGRGGGPEAAVVEALLARRLGRESSLLSPKGAAIALLAVEALGEIASAAGEDVLITALASALPGVPAAAARSLGHAGTARAVPSLRDAEERGGELRRAAREAVALIQSRLEGATPGQVSLAGGEEGQLSVAEGRDGRVSLEPGTHGHEDLE